MGMVKLPCFLVKAADEETEGFIDLWRFLPRLIVPRRVQNEGMVVVLPRKNGFKYILTSAFVIECLE